MSTDDPGPQKEEEGGGGSSRGDGHTSSSADGREEAEEEEEASRGGWIGLHMKSPFSCPAALYARTHWDPCSFSWCCNMECNLDHADAHVVMRHGLCMSCLQ